MAFKVIEIVSGDKFKVTPEWRAWTLKKGGNTIKAVGYNVPPRSHKQESADAKVKLFNLLIGKEIELKKLIKITPDKVAICEVYFDGKPLQDYFPEYQTQEVETQSTDEITNELPSENNSDSTVIEKD